MGKSSRNEYRKCLEAFDDAPPHRRGKGSKAAAGWWEAQDYADWLGAQTDNWEEDEAQKDNMGEDEVATSPVTFPSMNRSRLCVAGLPARRAFTSAPGAKVGEASRIRGRKSPCQETACETVDAGKHDLESKLLEQAQPAWDEDEDTHCGGSADDEDTAAGTWDNCEKARLLEEARSDNRRLSEALAEAETKLRDLQDKQAKEARSLKEARLKNQRLSEALDEARRNSEDRAERKKEDVPPSPSQAEEAPSLPGARSDEQSRALKEAKSDLRDVRKQLAEEARSSEQMRREKDRLSRALAKAQADLEVEARLSQKAQRQKHQLSRALEKARADLQAEERKASNWWARVAELERQSQALAKLADAQLFQWFYDGDAENGRTVEHEFSRLGNQLVEELYQDCLLSESTLGQLSLGKFTYEMNFMEMKQRNTTTGTVRRIRRKVFGGDQCTDLLEKVRHTLEARLQEAVVARKELDKAKWNLRVAGERQEQHKKIVSELHTKLRDAQTDLVETAEKLRTARVELEEAKEHHTEELATMHQEARRSIECWKSNRSGLLLVAEPLVQKVQEIFQQCSHQAASFQGMLSRCSGFQSIRVEEVRSVHNPQRFHVYKQHQSDMREAHRQRGVIVQDVRVLASDRLASLFPGICLGSNELLLVHGCRREAAMSIIAEGFDVRRAKSGLYGSGIYFAAEICKSDQYAHADPTGLKYMIVARVALGDPAHLNERYSGNLAPPRPDGSRFDSAIAIPARVTGQYHAEFVVYHSEQAYPELLVTYRCP